MSYKIYKDKLYVLILLIILSFLIWKKKKLIKVGVFGCRHDTNIGNYLIKYAMHIKLTELGYKPYIVTTNHKRVNISFLNQTTNMVIVTNYSDIKESDFDILLVNSDQTWRKWDIYFYDCGFLRFAENWNKLKFVYGASLGFDYWDFNKEEEKIIEPLIKKFSETSVREQGSIKLIEQHFGISPKLVLDPTLIIDKKYYLGLIKDYKSKIYNTGNYIFTYIVYSLEKDMKSFIDEARERLDYHVYNYVINNDSLIEDFLYHLQNSKAVITNSFHCTIFSVLFKKSFITFNYNYTGMERLKSLSELLGFENRIVYKNQKPDMSLLNIIPNINYEILDKKRQESNDYIIRNLKLFKNY